MAATKNWSRLKTLLGERRWRLANLYRIRDKAAQVVPFRPNWAQSRLFEGLAHRNVDLKVRQLGVTTGYCMLWLDTCLFSGNVAVGIVAHTKDDARIIFRDKIKFAYDRLPEAIRQTCPLVKSDAQELVFANGSSIRVGVTFRSGTVQILHVTEYGYVSLACCGALWLLYRGTTSRIARLELAVAECNKRHVETEKALAAANQRAESLGRSLTALWTIISLGAAGRMVRLPPLHELLEGNIRLDADAAQAPRQAAA